MKRINNDNLISQKFGRLTVLKKQSSDKWRNKRWLCQCDCGNLTIVPAYHLKSGNTKSCGCLQKEQARKTTIERNTTHSMSKSKTYHIWTSMLDRCRNKNNKGYKYYGGRGITICKRWLKFENFYKDMGDPPKGLSIDRIENNGNYELSNCRWATMKQNNNNKKSNVIIEYKGKRQTMMQWAEELGIIYRTLWNRLKRSNWPIEKALTENVKIYKRDYPYALYVGLQENIPGKSPIPLYNVTGGKYHKSTVTMSTLKKEGIRVYPSKPTNQHKEA